MREKDSNITTEKMLQNDENSKIIYSQDKIDSEISRRHFYYVPYLITIVIVAKFLTCVVRKNFIN